MSWERGAAEAHGDCTHSALSSATLSLDTCRSEAMPCCGLSVVVVVVNV